MELQSSNPKLQIHEKELILPVSDQSLHRQMMDMNSDIGIRGGTGDPIPGEESRLQEMNQQDHVDSDILSRGWSTTGKRMRNSRARVKIPGFSQDHEEAGDETSQPGKQKLPLKKRKISKSPGSCSGINGHSSLSGSRIMKPGELSENYDITNPGAETAVASINSNNNLRESLNEHVCNICNRSFKSYQALGGHKAHHNNYKAVDISFTDEKNGSTRRPRMKSNQLVHQCEICNKIFSQGQALGGHKRHCKGKASHGGGVLETENQPRILDFDLNELPPEWISEE